MQLIAHRGESAHFPENTMPAFEAALGTADGIELDLTITRDGHVVVLHDETLDRTTNGAGPVLETTWAALEALDAGGWFSEEFAGTRIPLLSQVLSRFRNSIELNLELKPEAYGLGESADLLSRVLDQLGHDAEGVILSSFDWRFLRECRARAPAIRLGVLQHDGDPAEALHEARSLAAESVHLHHPLVDPRTVERAHAENRRVLAYTVDDPEQLLQMRHFGVDGVFTNSTRSAGRHLDSDRTRQPFS